METRKIVIEIVSKDATTKSQKIIDKVQKRETTETIETIKEGTLVSSLVVNQAFTQVKGLVKNAALYYMNKHFTLKENYLMQRNVDNALTTINKVASFGTSVAGGFLLGNVPGAAVAAVGWVANEAFTAFKRQDQTMMGLNTTNIQTAFQRTRAGLSDGSRGTQN